MPKITASERIIIPSVEKLSCANKNKVISQKKLSANRKKPSAKKMSL
jgi:hypothetical protein